MLISNRLCLSNGSFILPNEPVRTSLRFSQLHISIMNTSRLLKKVDQSLPGFLHPPLFSSCTFMLRSFNFCSISSMFSH